MSTTRTLRDQLQFDINETKEVKEIKESKHHPAIQLCDKFYQSQTIIDVAKLFINGDKRGELNFITWMKFKSPEERKTLSAWAEKEYGHYKEKKEYDSALTPRQKTWLGVMYEREIGVNRDTEKAVSLYRQAEKEGDTTASYFLLLQEENSIQQEKLLLEAIKRECPYSLNYFAHSIRLKDPAQAIDYCAKSAKFGYSFAMLNLSEYYLYGKGVDIDSRLAYDYLLLAAENGNVFALSNLGTMYKNGTPTTPQNVDTAQQLYEASLKRNPESIIAHRNLGNLLANKNPKQALHHFSHALEIDTAKLSLQTLFDAAIKFKKHGKEEQHKIARMAFNLLTKTDLNRYTDFFLKNQFKNIDEYLHELLDPETSYLWHKTNPEIGFGP